MKKISLGSFPLVDVTGKDRKIFESYLIKVVSDLVTANQLSNSIHMDRVNYITPLSILKFIKEDQKNLIQSSPEPNASTQGDKRNEKAKVIKNAFRNTKQLYQAIASDPFYKTHVFYPIYIEEHIKSNYNYNDYNYDFLILSNDLIKQQLIDEIIFDDKVTMLFLVLKCLITPNVKVTDIGITSEGENFRKYFSMFLETCKNENINPFDMFIRIIKSAGKQKRNNVPGALSKISNALIGSNSAATKYHSKSFVNLFNTEGEIKSADFLINISLKQVNDFLSDTSKMDPNYNPMLRQYSQAKTHEYGKILSIIDALRAFNKASHVISDLNSSSMLTNLKVDDDTTLLVNKDIIVSELETIYFRRFLEDLKNLEKQAVTEVKNAIKKQFGIDISSNNIETEEKLQTELNKVIKTFKTIALELQTAKFYAQKFATSLGFANFEDIDQPNILNSPAYKNKKLDVEKYTLLSNKFQTDINDYKKKINTAPKEEEVNSAIKNKELSLTVNLEIFQAQLTAAYSEIYQYIYSTVFDNDIINLSGKTINIQSMLNLYKSTSSADLKSLDMTLNEISSAFQEELALNISNDVKGNFGNINFNYKNLIQRTITYDSLLNIIIKNIFVPIFTKYSNKSISESNRLKDLKANNNPLMKKILSKDSLFKAYILTSDTLVQSYELLHYIDTLKYEEGIINHPVSKVSNIVNKIDFMLKRLGLTENPVFIYHGSSIMLSMPAHLSLTGQNFISQVSLKEFTQFGNINWSQDLWNQNLMFGGPQNDKKYIELKNSIKKIEAEIKKTSEEIIYAKDKEKIKKEAKLKNQQEELRKKKSQLNDYDFTQTGNNFTSNTQASKRYENSNPYEMKNPRPGGNYNYGMDNRGYYQNERDSINNAIRNSDHLQQQQYPNFQRPYPKDEFFNPNMNDKNEFMNNPYIQNRFNHFNNSTENQYN